MRVFPFPAFITFVLIFMAVSIPTGVHVILIGFYLPDTIKQGVERLIGLHIFFHP